MKISSGDENINELIQCLDPVMPDTKTLVSGSWFTCQLCQEEVSTSRLLAHAHDVHGLSSEVQAVECIIKRFTDPKDWFSKNHIESTSLDLSSIMDLEGGATSQTDEDFLGLNPHFDPPDLDEVDDKFIDSLLNNSPPQNQNWVQTMFNNNNGAIYDFPDVQTTPNIAPSPALPSPSTLTSYEPSLLSKKPQFRWRRRKRRSKAQYPEMSQYLTPVDNGDEVQHLGRTLECQLCGLRGKRCHLTLHFKAKHSEVIKLTKNGKKKNCIKPSKITSDEDEEEEEMEEEEEEEEEKNVTNGAHNTYVFDKNLSNNKNNFKNQICTTATTTTTDTITATAATNNNNNNYKILDLEEALGKAFLFLKDALVQMPPVGPGMSSQIELACMKKVKQQYVQNDVNYNCDF